MTSVQTAVFSDRDESSNNCSDIEPEFKRKTRPLGLLDSDSDEDRVTKTIPDTTSDHEDKSSKTITDTTSDHENNAFIGLSNLTKSRIKSIIDSSDSDNSQSEGQDIHSNSRISIKKANLKSKFSQLQKKNKADYEEDDLNNDSTSDSAESNSSVDKIKRMVKSKNILPKSNLYDPDTSDEESKISIEAIKKNSKGRSIKMTSPKPDKKMTSKQAMENMQRIKSESNRMLREKEVSLPYHRPKALSLKDIMNKRKLTSVDGKSLPIKMNSEQLEQYAKLLEERQKEVIQLCKSDSENENETPQDEIKDGHIQKQNDEVVSQDDLNDIQIAKTFETNSENKEVECNDNIEKVVNYEVEADETFKNSTELADCTPSVIEHINSSDNVENINTEYKDIENNTVLNPDNDTESIHLHFDSETPNQYEYPLVPSQVDPPADKTDVLETDANELICGKEGSSLKTPYSISNNKVMSEEQRNVSGNSKDNNSNLEASFSDNDINYDEIDKLIENAEIIKDPPKSPLLVSDKNSMNIKPKLTGAPGMVIDLDSTDSAMPRKLSGVELFKERFTFFAKLKTPEELERQKNQKIKPGLQFLKLKQELEEEMAVNRSAEWSKREQENKLLKENDADLEDNDDNDISKLEEKILDDEPEDETSESEEDLEENDCDMEDKPRKHNPMLDDKAEESDEEVGKPEEDVEDSSEHENADSDDESSESETELKPRKNRILKAFEDSDDEELKDNINDDGKVLQKDELINGSEKSNVVSKTSQDDDIQLAQRHKSFSEDLFSTQESDNVVIEKNNIKLSDNTCSDKPLATQSFSILHNTQDEFVICKSQNDFEDLKAIAPAIPVSFTQNGSESDIPKTQGFGDDVLAMCTGNFFNNDFVTQSEHNTNNENRAQTSSDEISSQISLQQTEKIISLDSKSTSDDAIQESFTIKDDNPVAQETTSTKEDKVENCSVLKSILDELDSPELDSTKHKFFGNSEDTVHKKEEMIQSKKKFVIDTDDEEEAPRESVEKKLKKKTKKRRFEQRALQISDDEDDVIDDGEEYQSEVEDDEERLVEYDSEENEVEIAPQAKKKRKATDFFEDEAELTSEDEWVGSGDEDEANLDVMEREEGDNEVFHQGKLQRELEQIHMRDVLDQDKREVRIIQELLFEDGDLGDGHRQRKFRWKNMDGVEGDYNVITAFGESQEEDFENEAEWRKERHKREVFLRQMRKNEVNDISDLEISTTILKSNLHVSNDTVESSIIVEKRIAKDIPSPRKPLGIFQPNCHGSLLSKGESSLARLAALATPLNTDEDAPKNGLGKGKRNFVFSMLSQNEEVPTAKRKAESADDSPRLIKKHKTNKKKGFKSSLLDHLDSEIDIV